MISGGLGGDGDDALRAVEIYQPGNKSGGCRIANMPTLRYSTSNKEFLVCGGLGNNQDNRDCIIFNNGTWQNAHKLIQKRIRYNFQF